MILAVISDIDGHVRPLESVLAEIEAAGIQTIINAGDCVGLGSQPNETIGLLRGRAITSIQGDTDRLVARFVRKQRTIRAECDPGVFDALQRTYDALRSDHVEYLAGLPRERRLTIDGLAVYLCHGSPYGQDEGLHQEDELHRFQRFREMAQADIIVMGHTREPFSRMVDGTLFVNPGAVAASPASYAIVNTEMAPWSATFCTVNA